MPFGIGRTLKNHVLGIEKPGKEPKPPITHQKFCQRKRQELLNNNGIPGLAASDPANMSLGLIAQFNYVYCIKRPELSGLPNK